VTDTYPHAGPDTESPTECVCGGCGLIPVDDDYVNRHLARSAGRSGGVIRPGLREALRDSYRPCHTCRADQYEKWAAGEYGTGQVARGRGTRRTYRKRSGS